MKKFILTGFFIFSLLPHLQAAMAGKTVEYKDGDAVLEGYVAYDDSVQGPRPVVLVVHEWKGLNEYAQKRADQLAEMGYLGFAVDMYGKGVRPKDHQEAGKISGVYRSDRNLMRARAKASYDFIKRHELADGSRVAAIGYCFGGTTVLEMARSGLDLKGVASFHGSLDTPLPAKAGDLKAKVIVFQGALDTFTINAFPQFEKEMTDAEADWQAVVLGGAVHSFTVPSAGNDPSKGMAYNADADRRSWEMLKFFLKEIF